MTDAAEYEQATPVDSAEAAPEQFSPVFREPSASQALDYGGVSITRRPEYAFGPDGRRWVLLDQDSELVVPDKPTEGGDPTLGDRPRLAESAAQMAQLVSLAKTRPLSARDQAEELLAAALRDCAACLNDAGRQAVSDLLFAFDAVRKEDA